MNLLYNNILVFLILIGHVLGDFYFQSRNMSCNKNKYFIALLFHSIIYMITMILMIIPVWSTSVICLAILIAIGHFIIDFLKFLVYKAIENRYEIKEWLKGKNSYVYIIDQSLHITYIFILCLIFFFQGNIVEISRWLKNIFIFTGITNSIAPIMTLRWLLLLLLLGKPVNLTVEKLFSNFKPIEEEAEKEINKKTGTVIGTIERIIIVIFLSIQQYSAIGFVLTAKSIARYNKISEHKEFGEYYLLGTLTSVLFAIVLFLIVF